MKANIRLISGREQSTREFEFEEQSQLDDYLKNLHSGDPNGWIVFSIEGEEVDSWLSKMGC